MFLAQVGTLPSAELRVLDGEAPLSSKRDRPEGMPSAISSLLLGLDKRQRHCQRHPDLILVILVMSNRLPICCRMLGIVKV